MTTAIICILSAFLLYTVAIFSARLWRFVIINFASNFFSIIRCWPGVAG